MGGTCGFGGQIMKYANSEKTAPGSAPGVGVPMVGMRSAARRPGDRCGS
jgi:hypothetical protein